MLEIFVIIYGLVAMVRGKFSLGGDKVLTGWRARVTAGVLLCYLPAAFLTGIILALIGRLDLVEGGSAILFTIAWLVLTIIVTLIVGNMLYRGQVAEELGPSRDEQVAGYDPRTDTDPDSPYRPPRSG